jgi:hypothetical protein
MQSLTINNSTGAVVIAKSGAMTAGNTGAGIGYPAGANVSTYTSININGGVVYAASGAAGNKCGEGIGWGGNGGGNGPRIAIAGGANVDAYGCVNGSGSTVSPHTSAHPNYVFDGDSNAVYPTYFSAATAKTGTLEINNTGYPLYDFSSQGDSEASGVFWLPKANLTSGTLGSTTYYANVLAQSQSYTAAAANKENIFLNEPLISLSTSASSWDLSGTPSTDQTAAVANPSASLNAKVSTFSSGLNWNLTMKFVKADGSASTDGALICSADTTKTFAAGSGTLANTWGYGIGTTKPTTAWLKAPFAAATTIATGTGPMTSGGTTSDTTVWIGANVTTAATPCASYKGAMIFTALPAS